MTLHGSGCAKLPRRLAPVRDPGPGVEPTSSSHSRDEDSSTGCPWQNLRDRDLADLDAIDHDRQGVAGHEDLAGPVTGRAGLGIDQDLPPHHVEDPVEGNPRAA